MKNQSIKEVLIKQKEILESQGYTVAYLAVYGSQNYKLDIYTDDYQSDIDMKAIVVPTLDALITNSKPVSTVVDTEWGQCDIKDIRQYFQTLLKANPAYIETLFTEFHIVDERFTVEFESIFANSELLTHALRGQMIRAMYGMMCEKQKALSHPYPSTAHKIEEFGYDGKQLSHAIRLYVMMEDYFIKLKPMKECLTPSELNRYINDCKLNKLTLENAEKEMSETMGYARELRDSVLAELDEVRIDYSVKDNFLKLSQSIIKNKIIDEIKGEFK